MYGGPGREGGGELVCGSCRDLRGDSNFKVISGKTMACIFHYGI